MRTAVASNGLAKPDKPNPNFKLLSFVTDLDFTLKMKHLISIELTRIVIHKTPDDQEVSNLQKITNLMGSTHGIDQNISEFLLICRRMNFVIGPSTHGYYDGKFASSASYERQRLELIHPDITQNIVPNNNISSMREFY